MTPRDHRRRCKLSTGRSGEAKGKQKRAATLEPLRVRRTESFARALRGSVSANDAPDRAKLMPGRLRYDVASSAFAENVRGTLVPMDRMLSLALVPALKAEPARGETEGVGAASPIGDGGGGSGLVDVRSPDSA